MPVAEAHSFSKTRATAPPGGQEPSLGAQLHRTTQVPTVPVLLGGQGWRLSCRTPNSSRDGQPFPLGSPYPYHHGPAQALPFVIQLHGISKEEVNSQQELQQRYREEGRCRGYHVADEGNE